MVLEWDAKPAVDWPLTWGHWIGSLGWEVIVAYLSARNVGAVEGVSAPSVFVDWFSVGEATELMGTPTRAMGRHGSEGLNGGGHVTPIERGPNDRVKAHTGELQPLPTARGQ